MPPTFHLLESPHPQRSKTLRTSAYGKKEKESAPPTPPFQRVRGQAASRRGVRPQEGRRQRRVPPLPGPLYLPHLPSGTSPCTSAAPIPCPVAVPLHSPSPFQNLHGHGAAKQGVRPPEERRMRRRVASPLGLPKPPQPQRGEASAPPPPPSKTSALTLQRDWTYVRRREGGT